MSLSGHDPLLEKLRSLPTPVLDAKRSAFTLVAAESALSHNVRPKIRWPEFAIAIALSAAGAMYTVGSVNKLGEIYVSGRVAAVDVDY